MIFFWVAKISNIFLGCLKFLIFFYGEGQMLGPSLCMQKKSEYPPWVSHARHFRKKVLPGLTWVQAV